MEYTIQISLARLRRTSTIVVIGHASPTVYNVQVAIVTGNANATILLRDADDWTGHRTVRQTDQTLVEQVLDLTVDLGFDSVRYPVWPHLTWNEICGGLDTMHHHITPPWMVAELFGEFVE